MSRGKFGLGRTWACPVPARRPARLAGTRPSPLSSGQGSDRSPHICRGRLNMTVELLKLERPGQARVGRLARDRGCRFTTPAMRAITQPLTSAHWPHGYGTASGRTPRPARGMRQGRQTGTARAMMSVPGTLMVVFCASASGLCHLRITRPPFARATCGWHGRTSNIDAAPMIHSPQWNESPFINHLVFWLGHSFYGRPHAFNGTLLTAFWTSSSRLGILVS